MKITHHGQYLVQLTRYAAVFPMNCYLVREEDGLTLVDSTASSPGPDVARVASELGLTLRYAMNKDYEHLLLTMERAGFIQKGEQVSTREIDDMLQQYVEPVEVEVFHYTRKWLQKMTAAQMDRSVAQIKTARQLDVPSKLAIPMRVIASNVANAGAFSSWAPPARTTSPPPSTTRRSTR